MNALETLLIHKLSRALHHLEYSYKKILKLPYHAEILTEEQLETWESFSARFSRVCDVFLNRYLRFKVLQEDPGFTGTFRDFLFMGHKMGVIQNPQVWMAIRELRNITAQEYNDKDLTAFFETLKINTPVLLELKQLLDKR